MENLVTTETAATRLGISRTRVQVLIRAGRLPATKIGRDWMIGAAELERFAALERPRGTPRRKAGPR